MQAPPIPHDEQQRLHVLRGLHLLDTAAEERFDRLTRLAKQMFGVPIALVSLVDEQRQWFKSCQGLEVCETGRWYRSRVTTFHTILSMMRMT